MYGLKEAAHVSTYQSAHEEPLRTPTNFIVPRLRGRFFFDWSRSADLVHAAHDLQRYIRVTASNGSRCVMWESNLYHTDHDEGRGQFAELAGGVHFVFG